MRCRGRFLAVFGLSVSICASVNAEGPEDLAIGVLSTGKWYACSDQKIAENIAQTFVSRGGDAAITLFNQNALVCDISLGPTTLYVHGVVWHRDMHEDGEKMKVVRMSEWKGGKPSTQRYVLTLRAVSDNGVPPAWVSLPFSF